MELAYHYGQAEVGLRPELDLPRQRNAPGDSERAAVLLDEALAIARELGMRPLAERVQKRRDE